MHWKFGAAKLRASLASDLETPSNSNIIFPGFTLQIQYSGDPFPFPILTSAGLLETGTSGNILIQTLPARRRCLVMALLAASICLAATLPVLLL